MKKILTAVFVLCLTGGLAGCGGGECDKLEDCCRAAAGDLDSCEVPSGSDEDDCKDARTAVVLILELAQADVPDACQD